MSSRLSPIVVRMTVFSSASEGGFGFRCFTSSVAFGASVVLLEGGILFWIQKDVERR